MILDLIAKHESGGDYNRVYGRGFKREPLTTMTIEQVLEWQKSYVKSGSPSSAAGRYQIIRMTLLGLVKELKLTGKEYFNENTQDLMAYTLLKRRGWKRFLNGFLTIDKMVLNLSKEWASLPRGPDNLSYYDGDGLNQAHATYDEVVAVLKEERRRALTTRLLFWRKDNV